MLCVGIEQHASHLDLKIQTVPETAEPTTYSNYFGLVSKLPKSIDPRTSD